MYLILDLCLFDGFRETDFVGFRSLVLSFRLRSFFLPKSELTYTLLGVFGLGLSLLFLPLIPPALQLILVFSPHTIEYSSKTLCTTKPTCTAILLILVFTPYQFPLTPEGMTLKKTKNPPLQDFF